jgi:hypothetical protein
MGEKSERHAALCKLLNGIYIAKNQAYGDSFGKTFQELGIISAVTRMTDKFNRIKSLALGANPGDESMKDSLLDLANYCLMTYIELEMRID